jgi:hypothetical protein
LQGSADGLQSRVAKQSLSGQRTWFAPLGQSKITTEWPAMGGQDAMMGWAADGKRGLALVLGQGFVDRLESALPEQLATGGS